MGRTKSEAANFAIDNPDLSPDDIVNRLAAKGIQYSHKSVLQARYRARKAKPKMVGPRPSSASRVIVDLPSTMTNEEVYERVLAEGFDVSMHAVTSARMRHKNLLRPNGRGKYRAESAPSFVPPDPEPALSPVLSEAAAGLGDLQSAASVRRALAILIMRAGFVTARRVLAQCEAMVDGMQP